MKRVLHGLVLWGAVAVCAVFLFCALLFRVWSLGTWAGLAASGLVAAAAARWPHWRARYTVGWKKRFLSGLFALFILFVIYSAALIGCMTAGALRIAPEGQTGTVVVLGSKVNGETPSADLQARIDRAARYLLEHPECPVIASGGQGAGERISEAEAIRTGLIAQGVEADRIYLEDRSSSTAENIAFSKEVVEANNLPETMLFVTDEYHEFRAWRLAERAGVESWAIPGRTPLYLLPACVAREMLAITGMFLTV